MDREAIDVYAGALMAKKTRFCPRCLSADPSHPCRQQGATLGKKGSIDQDTQNVAELILLLEFSSRTAFWTACKDLINRYDAEAFPIPFIYCARRGDGLCGAFFVRGFACDLRGDVTPARTARAIAFSIRGERMESECSWDVSRMVVVDVLRFPS
jgi:hypothetical protein